MTITIKGFMGQKDHLDIVRHTERGDIDVAIIDATCIKCAWTRRFTIGEIELTQWIDGAHIQNVMPYLNADDRELMISGLCGSCFDRMFS